MSVCTTVPVFSVLLLHYFDANISTHYGYLQKDGQAELQLELHRCMLLTSLNQTAHLQEYFSRVLF